MRMDLPRGEEWILFAFMLVWMADIGGYFFGRRLGRTKLAPHVSPGKTWEGALGGLVLSVVVAIAGAVWFALPVERFLPLCLAVVAFSIVGDLTESLLKRYAGMKDSGSVFPGHGGVMDRIDSVTAAAPLLYFGLTTLGVLA
jgi:phosphatidate cytidylyltransferase